MQDLQRLGPDCAQLEALRRAAENARDAVVSGDFDALGLAMRENTNAQAELHSDLVHREAWRVIEIAAEHGATGWKVNGAGGDGGSITLLCDPRRAAKRATIRAIMQENPAFAAIPVAISRVGLSVISHHDVPPAYFEQLLNGHARAIAVFDITLLNETQFWKRAFISRRYCAAISATT